MSATDQLLAMCNNPRYAEMQPRVEQALLDAYWGPGSEPAIVESHVDALTQPSFLAIMEKLRLQMERIQ